MRRLLVSGLVATVVVASMFSGFVSYRVGYFSGYWNGIDDSSITSTSPRQTINLHEMIATFYVLDSNFSITQSNFTFRYDTHFVNATFEYANLTYVKGNGSVRLILSKPITIEIDNPSIPQVLVQYQVYDSITQMCPGDIYLLSFRFLTTSEQSLTMREAREPLLAIFLEGNHTCTVH